MISILSKNISQSDFIARYGRFLSIKVSLFKQDIKIFPPSVNNSRLQRSAITVMSRFFCVIEIGAVKLNEDLEFAVC